MHNEQLTAIIAAQLIIGRKKTDEQAPLMLTDPVVIQSISDALIIQEGAHECDVLHRTRAVSV